MFRLSLFFALVFLLSSCFGYAIRTNSYSYKGFQDHKFRYPSKTYNQLPILYEEPKEEFEIMARVVVTGNDASPRKKLLRLLKQEASRYRPDAVLFHNAEIVERTTFDAAILVLDVIAGAESGDFYTHDYYYDDYYDATQVVGLAIRYVRE